VRDREEKAHKIKKNQTTLDGYAVTKKRKLTPIEYSDDRKKAMAETEAAKNKK